MNRILFICSANMCRSPMAEGLFNDIQKKRGNSDTWQAESAGVWGLDGNPATSGAIQAMQRRGIDIRMHRARTVNKEMVEEADLILTMERNHKDGLRAAFPSSAKKVYMLTEMAAINHDVPDPIGGMEPDYEDTARELEQLLVV